MNILTLSESSVKRGAVSTGNRRRKVAAAKPVVRACLAKLTHARTTYRLADSCSLAEMETPPPAALAHPAPVGRACQECETGIVFNPLAAMCDGCEEHQEAVEAEENHERVVAAARDILEDYTVRPNGKLITFVRSAPFDREWDYAHVPYKGAERVTVGPQAQHTAEAFQMAALLWLQAQYAAQQRKAVRA